jgi:aminoglycoside N3'-acetyltransferase
MLLQRAERHCELLENAYRIAQRMKLPWVDEDEARLQQARDIRDEARRKYVRSGL